MRLILKILVIIFVSFATVDPLIAQWERIGLSWDTLNFKKIVAVTGTRLFGLAHFDQLSRFDSMIVSYDNGASWTPKLFLSHNTIGNQSWIIDHGNLFASGMSNDSIPVIYRSTDNGDSWDIYCNCPSKFADSVSSFDISGDTIVLTMSNPDAVPSLSIDQGRSWLIAGFPSPQTIVHFHDNIYTVLFPAQTDLRYSFDFINWKDHKPGRDQGSYIFDSRLFISEGNGINYGLKMLTINDTNWQLCAGFDRSEYLVPSCNYKGVLFATYYNPSTPLVANDSTSLYYSLDSGLNWQQFGSTVINAPNVFIGSEYIFLSGANELWRCPISNLNLSTVKVQSSFSSNIIISPNPTTGILSIGNAPENLASISILNILGNKVMELSPLHAINFTLDISALPAGVYYARFASPDAVIVRKIIKY